MTKGTQENIVPHLSEPSAIEPSRALEAADPDQYDAERLQEQRRTKKQHCEEDLKLRDILENSPNGISIVSRRTDGAQSGGNHLFVNAALVRMFRGTDKERLMKSGILDKWVHPEQQRAVQEHSKNGTDLVDLEAQRRRMDGSLLWVLINTRPIQFEGQDCTIVWHADITERKQTADALRHAEEMLREGVQALPVGFAVYDADDRLVIWNDNYRASFSKHGHLLKQGMRFEDLMRPTAHLVGSQMGIDDPEEFLHRRIHSSRRWEQSWLYRQSTGRWIETYDRPTAGGGFISVRTDVTARKHAEEALRQSQKMESIGTLAGGIAHDLNNTFVPILGLVELALEDLPQNSRERTNLEYILKAALRGRDLVGQILAFSRQDSPERKPVSLQAIIEEALQLLRSTLPATIEIQENIDEATATMSADLTQLHQVIINLCSNAAHAMEDKPGLLQVTLERVNLANGHRLAASGLAAGTYAQLTVRDTGHGMDRETAERIFDPFFTTKVVGEGTGLGLSVVHGIVTAHGGAIEVDSKPGQGTTFQILLPLMQDEAEAVATLNANDEMK